MVEKLKRRRRGGGRAARGCARPSHSSSSFFERIRYRMSTPQPQSSVNDQSYRAILDYLNRRGHSKAAAALTADLATEAGSPGSNAAQGGGKQVGLDDFADRNAPSQPRPSGAAPQQPGQPQRRRPDQAVAGGQLLADPPSWEKGYEGLSNFVEHVSLLPYSTSARSPADAPCCSHRAAL